MAFATSSARARLSCRLMRASSPRYNTLKRTTTAPTIVVTPRTCLPFIPMRMAGARGFLLYLLRAKPQLVQFIVQRLQTDAEDFGCTRLVVARVLKRHHDQAAL